MDGASGCMDETRISRRGIERSDRFRIPGEHERALGAWVDRIGSGSGSAARGSKLRLLGLHAVVGVRAGRGVFESPAAGRREVVAGDAMLLFPDEPARYGGEPRWETNWVVWAGPEAGCFAARSGLTPADPVVRGAGAAVEQAFCALGPLMTGEDLSAVIERKRALLGLWADLLRLRSAAADSRQPDAIAECARYAAAHAASAPGVSELAARCRLSVSQFRRRFIRRVGHSPRSFVTAQRMALAQALLARGLPIKEVAARTGYADPFHFMRVFRRVVGQTAGRFAASNP